MLYTTEDPEADYSKVSPAFVEYSRRLTDAGVVKSGARLLPSSTATTVRVRDDEELFTDGPFAESREQLGGYYVFECPDLDDALKWAARCPVARDGAVEVRPLAHR